MQHYEPIREEWNDEEILEVKNIFTREKFLGRKYVSTAIGLPPKAVREINFLKKLTHPNIIGIREILQDGNNSYLIMDHMDRTLEESMRDGLSDYDKKVFMHQMLRSVAFCHSKGVIHGDIRPGSIAIDVGRKTLKLMDFCHARTLSMAECSYTVEATIPYRAPELLFDGAPRSHAVDIWSLGCIFAEMLKGDVLFKGVTEAAVLDSILCDLGAPPFMLANLGAECFLDANQENFKFSKNLNTMFADHTAADLISKLLCLHPSSRITAKEALNHYYFRDIQTKLCIH